MLLLLLRRLLRKNQTKEMYRDAKMYKDILSIGSRPLVKEILNLFGLFIRLRCYNFTSRYLSKFVIFSFLFALVSFVNIIFNTMFFCATFSAK